MAHGSELMDQVLAFVSDNLQVVSYKWLSRKFCISSNEAKRLLQDFSDQHGDSIEVVYAVSGWSKKEPRCYSVQLVPKSKLQQAKDLLEDPVASHVYSVQPCIPKDPAELWSAEYVQSEELFNQPPEVNNCLRDNRFSAVSFLSVTRNLTGKNPRIAPIAAPKVSAPVPPSGTSKPSIVQVQVPPAPAADPAPTILVNSKPPGADANDTERVPQAPAVATGIVAKGLVAAPVKKKTAGALGQGGGSLASLWGRASSKPKANSPKAHIGSAAQQVPTSATRDAEAHIRAHEAACDGSSDDDAADFARVRRGRVNNGNGRKRRVVFEDEISDAEKEDFDSEMVVSLASPELPKERLESTAVLVKGEFEKELLVGGRRTLGQGKEESTTSAKKKSVTSSAAASATNGMHAVSVEASLKEAVILADDDDNSAGGSHAGRRGIDSEVKEKNDIKSEADTDLVRDTSPRPKTGPKKRKMLKTRIDDRGREVTEVVWETEDSESNDKVQNPTKSANIPVQVEETKPVTNRSVASGNGKASNVVQNPPSKGNNKPSGKAGTKDSQQGKILSFFKKKT